MQLREFVDTVSAGEPPLTHSADDIVAAGRRAERRRRAGLASAGAAGLVVVAVAGAFALPSLTGPDATRPDPGPAAPAAAASEPAAFDFTFKGYDAGRFHVKDPIVVSAAYQMSSIYMDGRFTNDESVGDVSEAELAANRSRPRLNAFLTVYRPGAFDPEGIEEGTELTVAGRRAVQATTQVHADPPAVPGGDKLLAWEYADNAWATVTSQSNDAAEPSFADLATLVPGLRQSPARPATLPFTVGHVPDGYQAVQVGSHASIGLGGIYLARDGVYGAVEYDRAAPPTTGLTKPWEQGERARRSGTFTITVLPSEKSNSPAEPGRTRCFTWHACSIWSADGKLVIEVSAGGAGTPSRNSTPSRADLSDAELTKIAESVRLADPEEDSTWIPAGQAVRP
ncbi:hypothetical protein [Spirilliplanes yamanashiensis]|uniref:Uncharacterized protein n=1 Tax=Spirilliplanes yamanashiensis TaxID=42233 RepID=A0A8J3YBL6_9ACTN|nr:hypothetical protein [Spirilliplanes yamanashiensis]MDP9819129.1 hypothetical protein [Spirilliplanes yamanashiensis]GIJ05583.1 hypothetical protein Sya03_49350 [Spirilliplanes yamanashiensis]